MLNTLSLPCHLPPVPRLALEPDGDLTPEAKTAAMALRVRRAAIGISQEELAGRTQLGKDPKDKSAVSQRTISDLEKGKLSLMDLSASRLSSLVDALDWTLEDLAEQTGISLPGLLGPPSDLPEPRDAGGFVRLAVIQAQGGTLELDDEGKEKRRGARFIDVPEAILNGSRPKDTKIVEILGSSMCCEDLRLTIPEGSFVLVNTVDEPQPGDILVCDLRIRDQWFRILKIFDRTGHIILRSYNDKHPPIILEGDMELIKVGVYVNHTGPGRLAMRRLNRARGLAKG